MNKFKRIFSKRSGFTLAEIIVAFAVFAIMAAMILQILNMVSIQRKSNYEYANEIDGQDLYLITNDKKKYNKDDTSKDKELSLSFGDENFKFNYQTYGADESGEVNGLAYYVSKEGERDNNSGGGDGGDDGDNDNNNNTGAQTDRMDARITGTKGFDYIAVNKVERDENNHKKYTFDFCAAGKNISKDDKAYANYRIYFYDKNGNPMQIVSASYVGCGKTIGTNTASESPDPSSNKYVVSLTGANGIRIGSPFCKSNVPPPPPPQPIGYVCKQCGKSYGVNENTWNNCKKMPEGVYWDPCANHLETIYPEPDPNPKYTGDGIEFTSNNHTTIEITFASVYDPSEENKPLSPADFGENGKEGSLGAYKYTANSTITGGINTGLNIYGAYPKKD